MALIQNDGVAQDLCTTKNKKNTVTREHLIKCIKRATGFSAAQSSNLVEQILSFLSEQIIMDKKIRLRMFGSFSLRYKNARVGRNPKTMVEADIPARKVVRFTPAPTLKKRINNNIDNIDG